MVFVKDSPVKLLIWMNGLVTENKKIILAVFLNFRNVRLNIIVKEVEERIKLTLKRFENYLTNRY